MEGLYYIMHVAIETMEWVNVLMAKCMEPNYMQGGFNLRNGRGQASILNLPCDGKAQALTLVLWFFTYHLLSPSLMLREVHAPMLELRIPWLGLQCWSQNSYRYAIVLV